MVMLSGADSCWIELIDTSYECGTGRRTVRVPRVPGRGALAAAVRDPRGWASPLLPRGSSPLARGAAPFFVPAARGGAL